jgi:hypothetical protein
VRDFEPDFVFFHPTNGILQYEIKSGADESKAAKQLQKNRNILKRLFHTYYKLIDLDENEINFYRDKYFPAYSYLYFAKPRNEISTTQKTDDYKKIVGPEKLRIGARTTMPTTETQNLFSENVFRGFLILIAGYRPDYFISALKCTLLLKQNIFTNRVNTINYYGKNCLENDNTQNNAKSVVEFLASLKHITHTAIDFGEYASIYLTPEQQKAVGFVDACGNFFPKRQILVGPPGSGKSLILMLKIFILGQMRSRQHKKIYFWSFTSKHEEKLAEFVSRNKSKFCREVKNHFDRENALGSQGHDVIFDEDIGGPIGLPQHDDQIVAFVLNGLGGNYSTRKDISEINFDQNQFEAWNFQITELRTVFRSTRRIQIFLHKFDNNENKNDLISGHNFDGVKVEEYIFKDSRTLKKALDERIRKLIENEDCKKEDIGLFRPEKYRQPRLITKNTTAIDAHLLRSLEYPVMIAVEPDVDEMYLAASRAICHLIIFSTREMLSESE